MLLFYNIFVRTYFIAIRIASLWNKKASEWIKGRKNWDKQLEIKLSENKSPIIWVHCSSAGEFEQGKPIIEALKISYPSSKILISFFSPSGYTNAAKYSYADYITYLPLDTRKNAERFIQLVKPQLVIFIKYEFWHHHLSSAAFHHIPLLLASATFRKDQAFFKWYGKFFRQMLFLFRHIFVQDESSLTLLKENNITHASISGDTRFDRVKEISNNFTPIEFIEKLLSGRKCIIAGSTWSKDDELLKAFWDDFKTDEWKLVIVPHEINEAHLAEVAKTFPEAAYYSSFRNNVRDRTSAEVIIINTTGLLSHLYNYATITYVGGGFSKDGIHNILEPAVWSKPVVFGPNYKKYREAKELIEAGGAFSVSNAQELKKLATKLLFKSELQASGEKAKKYILENIGATEKILQFIQEKRLLTN